MKISNSSWKNQLGRALRLKLPALKDSDLNLAVLGVGNEFRADDIAGLLIVRALQARAIDSPHLLLLEGGLAPENFTGKIRAFNPDLLLICDAADMGLEPGAVAWLSPSEMDGYSASSHTLPLSVLAEFVKNDIGCEIGVVGIQVGGLEMYQPVSEAVKRATEVVAQELAELFLG
ncbi:MAG: hydrogenase 3 maturation endopeptidase HyCI [Anaerolineae bacterium]|nr:hydrogenase 3 maturation endopeptidase HyCI [Anaerolineae bacterium]